VEEFKYLGTTLTNQNSIPEEIKSQNLRQRLFDHVTGHFREGGRVQMFGKNFNKSKFYSGRN
jgi:YesN/AraC family two-component response regulator